MAPKSTDGADEQDEQDDPLPEGTARVVISHKYLDYVVRETLDTDDSWLDDPAFEHKEPQLGGASRRESYKGRVKFEKGEEVPLPVARFLWEHHSDRLLCLDDQGEELNDPYRTGDSTLFSVPGVM